MKKLILLLVLCFTANHFYAQAPDPNLLKNEGNKALNAKDYATAFSKYNEYLKLTNNTDSVTAFNCGVCAAQTSKFAEAAKYFDVAVKAKYNLANAYVGKAGAFRDLKKSAEYLSTLQEGLEAVPGNAALEKMYAINYLKEGQAFQKAGKVAEAEESYKHIVTTVAGKKWKTDALYSLGVLLYNNGATTLKKATPLANSNPDKYATEKASADADFTKAVEYLEQAVALSPERAEIKKMLTQVQASKK